MERSLLGPATLVAAVWCRAGMLPEAGPRGKFAECSDHGQSGGRTGIGIARTLRAGCRPPPAGPPERSDPGRWRFRCSRPRNRNRSVYDTSQRQRPSSWPGWVRSFRSNHRPSLPPAGHPPTGASSFRPTFDRAIFQATDRRAARDRHPQPLTGSHATVRTAREKSGFKAGLRRRSKSGLERGQETPRHLHDRAAYSPTNSGGCSS